MGAKIATFDDLPLKLVLRIFAFLDLNDLVSVAKVSKSFAAAAENGSFYRRMSIDRRHRLDDVIAVLKRQRNHVRAFTMRRIADANTILKYVARCPYLNELRLIECDGECGIKTAAFDALFVGCPHIRQFALKKCELKNFPKLALAGKTVTSLSIVDNTGFRYPLKYTDALLPVIERNSDTLRSLKLRLDNITEAEQDTLIDTVKKCVKLQTFQFQYPHIRLITEGNFCKLFALNDLVSLSLVVASAPTACAEFFDRSNIVSKLRRLELGGEICTLMPQIIRNCPNLEVLSLTRLSGPPFIDNRMLMETLSNGCSKLRRLSLKSVDNASGDLRDLILRLPSSSRLPNLEHVEIEAADGVRQPMAKATTTMPLKIEFNLVPNFALETQHLDGSTIYALFRSENLLKFISDRNVVL